MAKVNLKLSNIEKASFPAAVRPMLTTLAERPFNNKEWIFEIKWDGFRVISKINGRNAELTSRNLLSFDERFPSVRKALIKYGRKAVLDGEVVALDEDDRPSFQHLQNYQRTGKGKIIYYIFDILWYNGYTLQKSPLIERKELLKTLFKDSDIINYSDHIEENGIELFNQSKLLKLEGIIAKKSDSKYYQGVRTQNWLKVKTIDTMDAVICGYTEPRGSRKYFGALILGVYINGKLTYVGHTGTGFNTSSQKQVYSALQKYAGSKSPFGVKIKTNMPVTWVRPKLVCEVKFSHLTNDNILRHPVFIRMRNDKHAEETTLNSQKPAYNEPGN